MKKAKIFRAILLPVLCLLLCACAAPKQSVEMDIHKVWQDIQAQVELPAMIPLDAELLASLYPNFPMDKVKEFEVHLPAMNVHATEIAFFEAVDEDAAMDVKTAVEGRKAALEEQWSMYLPDQYELVKNSSVEVRGKYVIYIVGDFMEQVTAILDNATAA